MDKLTTIVTDPVAIAKAVHLRYVSASSKGFTREKKGDGFIYLDKEGNEITDEDTLKRIRGLVLPPAWQDVWICPYANGHLQATGIDTMGRKQYRYHTSWQKVRNETKYDRLYLFGQQLPRIRKQITKDLRRKQLDKQKVIAIALRVMEETLIRVGNASYEKLYGSHGLTTLRNQHVKVAGSTAFFKFKGKKGVMHKIELKHAALTRLLKKVRDIPGHELFQYYEGDTIHSLDSGEVNEYLKNCTAEEFTCKDFRTWAGTVHALNMMAELAPFETLAECKKNIVGIIDGVACKLGNTRAVCKKYYIHPRLFEMYEAGTITPYITSLTSKRKAAQGALGAEEKCLLTLLKQLLSVRKTSRRAA
ncbi:DNA topoisomerase IB [Chitinophaga horti]|uniref:DNA topoisomerase n=1 Tax=Chitinophaga horti TaxID=2920382 RepID=A0ABY6IZI6_9BACT|nr:DNA topoisomerase IB [Chitinophaga horti]UYQ92695.1 DNA topoisomerase IB [Chitinophaga horti]